MKITELLNESQHSTAKGSEEKPPRMTHTCEKCGKKWQLQHHCKGKPDKKQDVDEGFSDIVKGVKRKVAGKADPKEVEHMYGRIARSAIKHKTPDQAEKDIERYKKVSKVVNKEGVAEEQLAELSPQTLASYKKKAGAQASELDKRAFHKDTEPEQAKRDIAKANKRFGGIVRATRKEFGK